jgi:putative transposase
VHQAPSSNQIERRLTTLFPSAALEDHAEAVGVIEREGKLQIPPLVWSFAFGFATGESRTLAAFRRSYNSTADESLSPGGYYQRLTPSLAEYLRDLVEYGLGEVAVPHGFIESAESDGFHCLMARSTL